MAKLLEVENLETRFFIGDGVVQAVNGISYDVNEGETIAVVGESGCGKSVGALSILRLIPDPPGRITGGSIRCINPGACRPGSAVIRRKRSPLATCRRSQERRPSARWKPRPRRVSAAASVVTTGRAWSISRSVTRSQ